MTFGSRSDLGDLVTRAGVVLDYGQLRQLETYLELLERWNRAINLTSLPLDGYPLRSLERLILEPFLAAQFVAPGPLAWVDVGSGSGSPAIPLKIIRPESILTLIEPRGRKAAFLSEAIRALHLADAQVLQVRFEDLRQEFREAAQLVTVRAVRLDADFWASGSAVLCPGGTLLSFQTNSGTVGSVVPANFERMVTKPLFGERDVVEVLRKIG